jgi:hypothetical protein
MPPKSEPTFEVWLTTNLSDAAEDDAHRVLAQNLFCERYVGAEPTGILSDLEVQVEHKYSRKYSIGKKDARTWRCRGCGDVFEDARTGYVSSLRNRVQFTLKSIADPVPSASRDCPGCGLKPTTPLTPVGPFTLFSAQLSAIVMSGMIQVVSGQAA